MQIRIKNLLPNVFVDALPEGDPSEVWGREVVMEDGKSYLIDAASGRGKTSLCAFLYGLRSDYQGEIFIDGKPLNEIPPSELRQRRMAILFQELRLFPELTAMENVLLKNNLTNFLKTNEIREMLCRLGLQDRVDTPCRKLSLGQQQRVAFVRMLAQPADCFMLDEPVSHLDSTNSEIMADMLRERIEKDGGTVVVTSIGRELPFDYDKTLRL